MNFADMTFRAERLTLQKKLNHKLLEEEEIHEHEQQSSNQSEEHLNSHINEEAHEEQGKNHLSF